MFNSIAATTTNTDDFNNCTLRYVIYEFKHGLSPFFSDWACSHTRLLNLKITLYPLFKALDKTHGRAFPFSAYITVGLLEAVLQQTNTG